MTNISKNSISKRQFISALFIFLLIIQTAAPYTFTTVDHSGGLSNAAVSAIVQDSSGFFWIGTQNGLNRYDGTSFKIFTNDPFNESSLSENLIQTLYLDKNDVLWIGTYGGLDRFDTRTEKFIIYRSNFSDATSLSNDLVLSICRDTRGYLWVGTIKGLNRFDERTGTFIRYYHRPDISQSIANDIIRAIYNDAEGNLWIGTAGGGLDQYDYRTDSFIHNRHNPQNPRSLPSDQVMAIDGDPDGNIWIATWDYGISRYIPKKGVFENHRIPDARAYCISAKKTGLVRAGSWGGGFWEYSAKTDTFSVFRHNPGDTNSLSNNTVYSFLNDRNGDFWIGTNGGGFNRLNGPSGNYTLYRNSPTDTATIAPGKVTSILDDSKGIIWVGVYGGGVNRIDTQTGRTTHYVHTNSDDSLSNDIVNALCRDSQNTLWALTNEGMSTFDVKKNTFIKYTVPHDPAFDLSSNPLVAMLENPQTKDIWIGTYLRGLISLNPRTRHITTYVAQPNEKNVLSDPVVTSLAYDQMGRLWVGTNNGLNRMTAEGRFINYFHNAGDRTSIPGNAIRSLYLSSHGILWIACKSGGIARYNSASDTFTSYGTADGLASNQTNGFLEDTYGNLWITTSAGLSVLNYQSQKFMTPPVQEDLENCIFSAGRCADQSGLFYFGSEEGLYAIDPLRTVYTLLDVPVRITGFRIKNEEQKLPQVIYLTQSLSVPYRLNDISFSFSALDYRHPGQNEYVYKLEGYDQTWVPSGRRNFANYTNLPGGNYEFRVSTIDYTGARSTTEASVRISVSSPPWLRPWAIGLYILASVGFGILLVYIKDRVDLANKVKELTFLKLELEKANRKLEYLSLSDSLTGIPNRRKLSEEYEHLFVRAVTEQKPIGALMLDIDYFKLFNDTYGHPAGDRCLCTIAKIILASLTRPFDFAARYGGEEFIILLPDTDQAGAAEVAEKIIANIRAAGIAHTNSPVTTTVTVSIGVASIIPGPVTERHELISGADAALYRAKQAGRNQFSF
jgi:diguanylate cyclase (GGDEF)-like protein